MNSLRLWMAVLLLICPQLGLQQAKAHEMGVAVLNLQELQAGKGLFVFKLSRSADGLLPPVHFTLTDSCATHFDGPVTLEDNEVTQQGRFDCEGTLQGVKAEGFTRLAPDLIVALSDVDGQTRHAILSPGTPFASLVQPDGVTPALSHWLWLGAEHLLFGLDHLLFLLALCLLWMKQEAGFGRLLGQLTLFTIGHSLTLALLVSGWVSVPSRAIEAWIALSVLYLAVRAVECQQGEKPHSFDYGILLFFGLLHGLGFALSLADRGLPEGERFMPLLAFNLGIELGQVVLVSLILGLTRPLQSLSDFAGVRLQTSTGRTLLQTLTHLPVMIAGGAALYWTIERIAVYV